MSDFFQAVRTSYAAQAVALSEHCVKIYNIRPLGRTHAAVLANELKRGEFG